MRTFALLLVVASAVLGAKAYAAEPSWPCCQGPNGNFSATDSSLTLVDDLHQARLLWKSEEQPPPGAAQHERQSGRVVVADD